MLKHFPNLMGSFAWASNRAEIIWQGLPFIDTVPVPLVNNNQAFGLPQAGVENKHRAVVLA